jgi:uncharacterized membrane protein
LAKGEAIPVKICREEKTMTNKYAWVWAIMFILFVGYMALTAGLLPEGQIASHFDFEGKPNGSQNKTAYLIFMLAAAVLLNCLFLALYRWIDRVPSELINIPKKDYWFSTPERKLEAFQKLRGVLSLSGAFLNGVFLFCQQLVYQENAAQPFIRIPMDSAVWFLLALVIAFIFTIFRMTSPSEK